MADLSKWISKKDFNLYLSIGTITADKLFQVGYRIYFAPMREEHPSDPNNPKVDVRFCELKTTESFLVHIKELKESGSLWGRTVPFYVDMSEEKYQRIMAGYELMKS